MKVTPLILQTPQPIEPSMPPVISGEVIFGVLIAAGGWLGRQIWEHITKKDQAEAALNRELINGLQTTNKLLLDQFQNQIAAQAATQERSIEAVRELKLAVEALVVAFTEIRQQMGGASGKREP